MEEKSQTKNENIVIKKIEKEKIDKIMGETL